MTQSLATGRTYNRFGHRAAFNIPAVAVTGTNASETQVAATKIVMPFPVKITGARRINTTASTAAVANWNMILQKSVAGTGSYTAIGTYAVGGTEASGVTGSATLSSTEATVKLAAGDVLAVALQGITAARNDTVNFQIAYEELPN